MANLSRTGTCDEDGCDGVIHAKRMCKRHYSAWYREQNPDKVASYNDQRGSGTRAAVCVECSEQFTTRRSRQRFCSVRCQRREERRRHRREGRHLGLVECDECGALFTSNRWAKCDAEHQRRYCSPECQRAKGWRLRKSFAISLDWRECSRCAVRFISRYGRSRCDACHEPGATHPKPFDFQAGYCAECGNSFVVAAAHRTVYCSRRCGMAAKRRDYDAKKREAFVERVFRRKVFNRDGWVCRLCGEPTSRKWASDDPLAPTIDHIIPVAKGGEHSYANTQCAHAICNSRKQDRV